MTQEVASPEISAGTLSPDGGFYWDGAVWLSALSPDGHWTWNGAAWVATQSRSGPGSFHPYMSPRDLGLAASILLAITSAVTVAEALVVYDFLAFDGWVNDLRVSYSIGIGSLLVFMVTAAVFLGWFHRSYRNLAALGATDRQFSPASAVGSWFIPVAGFWKPYRAMHEMWRAGDISAVGSSNLIRLWWAAWLVSLVLFNVAAFSGADDHFVSWQGALSAQATVLAAVLAILVIRSVSARQDERWRHVNGGESNRERS
jgi:hypothetical protein